MRQPDRIAACLLACLLASLGLALPAAAAPPAPAPPAAALAPGVPDTRGVVELETVGPGDLSVSLAEDIAGIVDDGATRRVLPVLGKGSAQNLADLAGLRGIDMAVVQADVLEDARRRGLASGLTYVARLYDEEFCLLVRDATTDVSALRDQVVDVGAAAGGTRVTAEALFGQLRIPVRWASDPLSVAIGRLRRGEVAAVALVAPRPALGLAVLRRSDGLHLLGLPAEGDRVGAYPRASLSAQDYPELVSADHPVDTAGVGMVLLAASLPPQSQRFRNMARFVDVFFTQFASLLEPGHLSTWADVDLYAELPGMRRFGPAEQWLQRNPPAPAAPAEDDLRATFSRFIDQRQRLSGAAPLSAREKDDLFERFEHWDGGQHP